MALILVIEAEKDADKYLNMLVKGTQIHRPCGGLQEKRKARVTNCSSQGPLSASEYFKLKERPVSHALRE